jgi:AcrR family transcriptional regulator
MTKRLTSGDWIEFALTTLARKGHDALKADVLARKLGVSRGSFYWHFADLRTFHSQVIAHWKQVATEAIIADIERHQSLEQRLDALLRHAFGDGSILEIRMRRWADGNEEASLALRDVDRRRRDYLSKLLIETGIAEPQASIRAQLLYWTYLGAASRQSKVKGIGLDRIVAELMQFALNRPRGGRRGPTMT